MFFRFALIRHGDVLKRFETRFPAIVTEGKMIGAEMDFGDLINDQELTFKVTIDIYSYIWLSILCIYSGDKSTRETRQYTSFQILKLLLWRKEMNSLCLLCYSRDPSYPSSFPPLIVTVVASQLSTVISYFPHICKLSTCDNVDVADIQSKPLKSGIRLSTLCIPLTCVLSWKKNDCYSYLLNAIIS